MWTLITPCGHNVENASIQRFYLKSTLFQRCKPAGITPKGATIFKGTGYTFRGGNLMKIFLTPEKGLLQKERFCS